MNYQKYSQKIALVEVYIKNKWANTPSTIAKKLEISERTVLRMIDFLKKQGKQIEYCKKEKIYKIF
ncbi:MAG: HTH domain-containing protein [Bacteroidetes bacterium]|nr:HTH domain-containing protein [Bacteroidota bacterium]